MCARCVDGAVRFSCDDRRHVWTAAALMTLMLHRLSGAVGRWMFKKCCLLLSLQIRHTATPPASSHRTAASLQQGKGDALAR